MTTFKFLRCMHAFYEKGGRGSRYIGEVLEWHRGEDAGDLRRGELDELVQNWTYLNALEVKISKRNQKVVTDEKINPKILMDEKS